MFFEGWLIKHGGGWLWAGDCGPRPFAWVITVGAGMATAFVGVFTDRGYASGSKRDSSLCDRIRVMAVVSAVPVARYLAGIGDR